MTFQSTDEAALDYLQSLQALAQEEIIEENPKLHYSSDQSPINLPAIVGCLNWIALRTRPHIAWAKSRAPSLIMIAKSTCEAELIASSVKPSSRERIFLS